MARPKKGEEKHRNASLRFRVRQEVSDGLRAIASVRGVPIADIGEAALEDYVRRVTKAESRATSKRKA
jgi:hypothetical protein